MTYEEIVTNAKQDIGKYCKACMVCNGRACRNQMPGPGAKGMGDTAIRNFDKWQEIRVQMDTISEHEEVDTSFVLWGQRFRYPFFAGPVGAVNLHYGEKYNDQSYNDVMVAACAEAGIAAMTGDGVNPDVMKYATDAIRRVEGKGIPTIKPWNIEIIREKMKQAEGSGAFAVAMDIDAAGLPFLKNMTPPAGRKSVEELRQVAEMAKVPFIAKGIMTARGAIKAVEAVQGKVKIFVDGGIRSGVDVFKALALGADGVLICRPFVTAVYGGGMEGVKTYIEKIGAELADTMAMCGANSLKEITKEMIYLPR